MTLREELESTLDIPARFEMSDESYAQGVKSTAKHFLKALDNWKDFDPSKDWRESTLGSELFDRADLPKKLSEQLSGAQVGMASNLAYQAFMQKTDAKD